MTTAVMAAFPPRPSLSSVFKILILDVALPSLKSCPSLKLLLQSFQIFSKFLYT
jgi:hypothetical protein